MGRSKPLFSRTLQSTEKIYFVDVYEGRQGGLYLSICENHKDRDGNFTRIRMHLAPEMVPGMRDALDEIHAFFQRYNLNQEASATA